jgi:HAD superfamily hydrolase (TIGR01509 family)
VIRAVVFDLDGTLLRQGIDFAALRRAIGAPPASDIIRFLESLPPRERAAAERTVGEHERRAAESSELNDGARELLGFLRSEGIPSAVNTRNSRFCLDMAIRRHALAFDASVSREDAPPKPAPESVLRIAERLGLPPASLLVVGDFAFDTESALRAGALAVYLSDGKPPLVPTRTHFVVEKLGDLIPLIRRLRAGDAAPGEPVALEPCRAPAPRPWKNPPS